MTTKATAALTLPIAALAIAAIAISSCLSGGTPAAAPSGALDSATDFSGVIGREWILTEIRTKTGTVTMDRAANDEIFGDIFTLRFGEDMVFGTAAPNTFRGPYTLLGGGQISLGMMASTMMAAFQEPDELTENEFFAHLGDVADWSLEGGNLILHVEDAAGTLLVFEPF